MDKQEQMAYDEKRGMRAGGQSRFHRRVLRRTGGLRIRDFDRRNFVTSLRPLKMRGGELEEARELLVGRLCGADEGRHAGVLSRSPLIR